MGRTKRDSEQYKDVKRMMAISDNYSHCTASLNNSSRLLLNDSDSLKIDMYVEYIKDVENSLCLLDPLDQKVITKEFFEPGNRFWWLGLFSRTTFYRIRRRAIEKFLGYFYEQ